MTRLRSDQRRAQLLDIAEGLFIERGYAAVTMEDVARGAGVSRPIPYNHFANKEGLFLACVGRIRRQYDAGLATLLDSFDGDRRAILRRGGEYFFAHLAEAPGRWKLMYSSASVLPEEYAAQVAQGRAESVDTIARVLRTISPDADHHAILAAAYAISGVGEQLGQWWLREPELEIDELVDHYVRLLWSGIGDMLEP